MKMATIVICDRASDSAKSKRIKVDHVKLNDPVASVRKSVAQRINLAVENIELIYCGRILQDAQTLDHYGIQPGVTVHVLRRKVEPQQQPTEPMDRAAMNQVVTALQAAVLNPVNRTVLEQMLKNPETTESIVAAVPSLAKDPVALAMVQDPEVFIMLADPSLVEKVITAHPSLAAAAMHIVTAVNEEGAKARSGGHSAERGSGTYSLDQMSDDEDIVSQPPPGGSSAAAITAAQLRAALAAASPSSSSSSPQQGGPSTSEGASGGSVITQDFFMSALQSAASSSASVSGPQPPTQEQLQGQLQQLRDMGITDDAVALRALEASGGNIQTALELIFGDEGF